MIEHDGCVGCRFDELEPDEFPCSHCQGTVNPNNPRWVECTDFYEFIPNKTDNPYWERICAMSERQRAKGMSKYGYGLESNPDGMLKRIEHLQEELIDALMYCEWMKDELAGMSDAEN